MRLRTTGLILRSGPFTARVKTSIPCLIDDILRLYVDYPLPQNLDFADFHVSVDSSRKQHWFNPKALFRIDGDTPYIPVPFDQALTALEWGLNLAIWSRAHHYLIIHAAAIARNGRAAIMPAMPGAGKSTLTAALVHRGWRLLSDELALVSPFDGGITPLVRPINLKNESIDIIERFVPRAVFSRKAHNTVKGTVALLKAPKESITGIDEVARPAWIIFPKYSVDSTATLEPMSKATTLLEIGRNAFNYSIHGARGFRVIANVIDRCQSYNFTYSDLDEAVSVFAKLQPSS